MLRAWEPRTTSILAVLVSLALGAWLAVALESGPKAVAGPIGGSSLFLGASQGVPVAFDPVLLPPVAAPRPFALQAAPRGPCVPAFVDLVNGETVITDAVRMKHVWRLLFKTPLNPTLFDFDTSFVVLMGGGLLHPDFGFDITSVDQFEATFTSGGRFAENYLESALAVVGTTFLPGPPPKPADDVYKVAAVIIPNQFLDDIVFNRQVFALP